MVQQNESIHLSREKPVFNLQQKITCVCGLLCGIWTALEMKQKSMEDSGEKLYEVHLLAEISQ